MTYKNIFRDCTVVCQLYNLEKYFLNFVPCSYGMRDRRVSLTVCVVTANIHVSVCAAKSGSFSGAPENLSPSGTDEFALFLRAVNGSHRN